MRQKLRKQGGFTIVEVMIVLAIAGLILLIVFLAVPALQRNSRNNARKNDVSRIGSAATEFVTNNNGKLPTNTAADLTALKNQIGSLSQYDVGSDFSVASGTQTGLNNVTKVALVTGAKCGSGGATTGGTSRQMAVQYMNETSNQPVALCQDV